MKRDPSGAANTSLGELAALDRGALAERWATVFGCPAPLNCRSTLLRGALAWHRQMAIKENVGTTGVAQMIRKLGQSANSVAPTTKLGTGTRLLRNWQGQTHHVTVLDQGFEYGGKTYRSLTAIARHITGTAWSGPLFFGVRR